MTKITTLLLQRHDETYILGFTTPSKLPRTADTDTDGGLTRSVVSAANATKS
jgi:hypothetical protein